MKKSLFAIAAVTAFAGAAQAQSSVTVYGIIDAGYIGGNVRSATSSGATTKGTYNTIGQSAESTSRLGFKGSEDLGGGMSAVFTFETGLQPDNATLSTFNTRQAFVGLNDKKMGMISIGTQYLPIHEAVAKTDAGQQNNMVGDLIYPIAPANNGNAGVGQFATNSNTDAYTIRASNTVRYMSPNIAGFVAKATYTANNQNTTVASSSSGGTNNQNGWALGVDYTWKKLLATANYQAMNSRQDGSATVYSPASYASNGAVTVTSSTLNKSAVWSGAAGGTNVRDNQFYIAATYDFGILKAYAQYINRKATDQFNSNNFVSRTAQQIGVRSFITPKIEAWASGGTGRFDSFGASTPTVNFTGYQLGSNYWLSKRTNLYAIFGSTQQSSSTLATQPSVGANNYAVGVRHTF
ncbi:porin [Polynucleobacter sp. es-EL-1]|uniref:porin n=1 Tax=Polynucleobacter sp. es-EL-1 TaxID=1855652 RepID=UPI001BFE397F|nr:porin [Polynucleobacter sp. es-EL-1]QWE10693.1 porin [Polynucleobacter sp. es-EL-1]